MDGGVIFVGSVYSWMTGPQIYPHPSDAIGDARSRGSTYDQG